MPTTRLKTTMDTSNAESRASIEVGSGAAFTQCFLEQHREMPELIETVVELRRYAHQRHGLGVEPRFDAASTDPVVQGPGVERRAGSVQRQRDGGHRADHAVRGGSAHAEALEEHVAGAQREL